MKILVAIVSCHAHRHLHDAQRQTWLKDLVLADYKFFVGEPTCIRLEKDEESLSVDDGYEFLTRKTRAICNWALGRDYDYLFKTDTDTIVDPQNLLFSDFHNHDYFGGENEDDSPYGRIRFASGGAGYWLSRKSLTIVALSDSLTNAEDVFVAAALRRWGILPVWHPGYKWRPGAAIDKDTVSLHLSSALQKKYETSMMYEAYEKLKRLQ
jgi:hypothetical protein